MLHVYRSKLKTKNCSKSFRLPGCVNNEVSANKLQTGKFSNEQQREILCFTKTNLQKSSFLLEYLKHF